MRILVVTLALLSNATHAGTVFETVQHAMAAEGSERVSTTYAQDGRMRVESGDGKFVIFKDDALYVVNNSRRSYVTMNRETVQKMAGTMNSAMQQMRERMASLPPEKREQMERMMGKQMGLTDKGAKQEIRKTSRTDKVAGYSCTYAEVLYDGVLQDEMCVVPPAKLAGGNELMASAQKLGAFMHDLLKDIDAPWLKQSVDSQMQNFVGLGGVPILVRHYAGGKPVSETTLKSIRMESLPAGTFDVPEGYTSEMPMGRSGAAPTP